MFITYNVTFHFEDEELEDIIDEIDEYEAIDSLIDGYCNGEFEITSVIEEERGN